MYPEQSKSPESANDYSFTPTPSDTDDEIIQQCHILQIDLQQNQNHKPTTITYECI